MTTAVAEPRRSFTSLHEVCELRQELEEILLEHCKNSDGGGLPRSMDELGRAAGLTTGELEAEYRRIRRVFYLKKQAGSVADRKQTENALVKAEEKLSVRGSEIEKQLASLQEELSVLRSDVSTCKQKVDSQATACEQLRGREVLPSRVLASFDDEKRELGQHFRELQAARGRVKTLEWFLSINADNVPLGTWVRSGDNGRPYVKPTATADQVRLFIEGQLKSSASTESATTRLNNMLDGTVIKPAAIKVMQAELKPEFGRLTKLIVEQTKDEAAAKASLEQLRNHYVN